MSPRDKLQRPYGNDQRLESHQAFQTPGGEGNQDKGESSHYQSYRRTAEPDRSHSDSFRLTRSNFQEKTRIQGQKQDLFQTKAERVRPNDPEAIELCERSTQNPEIVVNNSRISTPTNRNITPTQTEHNVVTPENEESKTPDTNARRARACSKMVEIKDKPRERVAEVTKKKNYFHNCGSTDHYANKCPKEKKKVYDIEKVLEEESPTEDSESGSMGDAIRKQYDEDQEPREEFIVEYQEETPLEIQDIQLEAGLSQNTANKNLCKHTHNMHKHS
ncbi:hypothetical protein O181_015412 [Austropuccinia psidii MF-1]|uniref:Uncharacterized protein n=1 Tax=Austropuccinia psidii MF-1 TaxID=1389203 RepID=A0A9Q3C3M5_9BASI|nr:hypothetical protein [Austropuccinia psidii MF-1]